QPEADGRQARLSLALYAPESDRSSRLAFAASRVRLRSHGHERRFPVDKVLAAAERVDRRDQPVLDAEQNRLRVLSINVRLRIEDLTRDPVLVVYRDAAHGELAGAEARSGKVGLDRFDALAGELEALQLIQVRCGAAHELGCVHR